jgi:hypothetical protein
LCVCVCFVFESLAVLIGLLQLCSHFANVRSNEKPCTVAYVLHDSPTANNVIVGRRASRILYLVALIREANSPVWFSLSYNGRTVDDITSAIVDYQLYSFARSKLSACRISPFHSAHLTESLVAKRGLRFMLCPPSYELAYSRGPIDPSWFAVYISVELLGVWSVWDGDALSACRFPPFHSAHLTGCLVAVHLLLTSL